MPEDGGIFRFSQMCIRKRHPKALGAAFCGIWSDCTKFSGREMGDDRENRGCLPQKQPEWKINLPRNPAFLNTEIINGNMSKFVAI